MKKLKGYIITVLIALSITGIQIALIYEDVKTHHTITGLSLIPLLCVVAVGIIYSAVMQIVDAISEED